MLRTLACSTLVALSATSAWAAGPLAVQAYGMYDWSRDNSNSWYQDGSYNGTVSGGWLSGGTGELTDGLSGASVAGGYSAWDSYVLWDGYSPAISFDLGSRFEVQSIAASFVTNPTAAVYVPPSVNVAFSEVEGVFGAGTTVSLSAAPAGDDMRFTRELLVAPGNGRYVQVSFTSPGRWMALSEVAFSGQASAVPEPESLALLLAGLGLLAWRVRRPG